jgi:hypothetical protein
MTREEMRMMRAVLEGMTQGMDFTGRCKTWEAMLRGSRKEDWGLEFEARESRRSELEKEMERYETPLPEIEISSEEYHKVVSEACEHGARQEPTLAYPEAFKDLMTVSSFEIDTGHSPEYLMLKGQSLMIARLKEMARSKRLREDMARRVMIRLV